MPYILLVCDQYITVIVETFYSVLDLCQGARKYGIVTGLQVGQYVFQIPAWERNLSHLQTIQTRTKCFSDRAS
jgi:hypothetical protein